MQLAAEKYQIEKQRSRLNLKPSLSGAIQSDREWIAFLQFLQSIVQSKDIVVHVVCIRTCANKLEHFTTVEWIGVCVSNAHVASNKNDNGVA